MCDQSVDFEATCLGFRDWSPLADAHPPMPEYEDSVSVSRQKNHNDEIQALYDGWTLQDFIDAKGRHPAELGLVPEEIVHPWTNERVEVYWTQSSPPFKLCMSSQDRIRKITDLMPKRVYEKQPDNTFDYVKRQTTHSALPDHPPKVAAQAP